MVKFGQKIGSKYYKTELWTEFDRIPTEFQFGTESNSENRVRFWVRDPNFKTKFDSGTNRIPNTRIRPGLWSIECFQYRTWLLLYTGLVQK